MDSHHRCIDRAITFINKNQNEDGGWGYWPHRESYTEPSGLCILALHHAGIATGVTQGLTYVTQCQLESGGVGINRTDREGSWMSYAALMAFHALGASKEEQQLTQWILHFYDGYENIPPDVVHSMYQEYRYDMTIDGWPWLGSTNSWVEPTALLIIALIYAGVERQHKRISSGLKLLMDRQHRDGGWNYGNPYMKNTYLDSYPLATAIALKALGIAGYTEAERSVKNATAFLAHHLGEGASHLTLAWSMLAFRHFTTTREKAEAISLTLQEKQLPDGSFRNNLCETALACLALSRMSFNEGAHGGAHE